MGIRGVLLDFSGTVFRLEPGTGAVDGLHNQDGSALTADRYAELLALMTVPTGVPAHLPADLHDAWHRRDLDPEVHRAAYQASLSHSEFGLAEGVATQVYDLMLAPSSWRPYPDTEAALRLLRAKGVPVAVVSNIAWDVRDTFAHWGLAELVDEYVLSYAVGVMKPDAKIFEIACERIAVSPADALMIGDSAKADGAAALLGCRFERVEPQATANRPDALLGALRTHGIAD
ncbi:HAD superfamily hydrolase (TIGR01493 family) [Actinokineospora baliensis]|uniref:HAD family hydrolase n=1 Tax=Actinokineospora baliensis TaxID=547056 RepID=UPI0027DC5E79|nr:HAD-IA family hydrolase [Actinokineospora baliensis]MBM7771481.1 HAD superfamily hydrolase (TIGR01493 family) [Actinokineospora baliensis]